MRKGGLLGGEWGECPLQNLGALMYPREYPVVQIVMGCWIRDEKNLEKIHSGGCPRGYKGLGLGGGPSTKNNFIFPGSTFG